MKTTNTHLTENAFCGRNKATGWCKIGFKKYISSTIMSFKARFYIVGTYIPKYSRKINQASQTT